MTLLQLGDYGLFNGWINGLETETYNPHIYVSIVDRPCSKQNIVDCCGLIKSTTPFLLDLSSL